ncbi:MAG: SCO1 protein [Gammaproteobacteria bacterium]|nr:SCO1 protein [Gammaproteobacteria bacterium]
MRAWILASALGLLIAGCGGELSWQTNDIGGLMPRLKFTLTSENGRTVTEKQYQDTVNLLFFGYTSCPDVCPITLSRLRSVIERLPADVAEHVRVLFVSVDPQRDNPGALREYTSVFGNHVVGLTGTEAQLDALTQRYRTTYGYGEPDEQGNYEVSHGSAVYAFDQTGEARLLIRDNDSLTAIVNDIRVLVRT